MTDKYPRLLSRTQTDQLARRLHESFNRDGANWNDIGAWPKAFWRREAQSVYLDVRALFVTENDDTADGTPQALQAILQQFQEQLDRSMAALLGELGAVVSTFEDNGSDESNALGIYNQAHELRLRVKAFFDTWLDK
ncbi:hypothetical protein PWY87_29930 [Kribbella solani]|uniref:hypothetical protein n=1 Tax=Kribbella solani TaxID=236067 RepID=UPI0029B17D7D|nr:hypothetical protein [Kribbella solani]MDX3005935.1 hypothetical protein [Kribbella solani]